MKSEFAIGNQLLCVQTVATECKLASLGVQGKTAEIHGTRDLMQGWIRVYIRTILFPETVRKIFQGSLEAEC